jgi:hypothetical protein
MSIEGLIVGMGLLLIVGVWIGFPFLRRSVTQEQVNLIQRQRERLVIYYERTLTNLRDLDEDHATGKTDAETFEAERELWVQRGIQALKALDQLDGNEPIPAEAADVETVDSAIDSMIEEAVAQYRSKSGA